MAARFAKSPERPRLLVEELEPRILFSADAAAMLGFAGAAEVRPFEVQAARPDAARSGVESAVQAVAAREIVFIDSRVPDAFTLADEIAQQRGSDRSFDIVILDATQDGIEQINRVLASERSLSAIHIISHGSDGAIEIGTTRLDSARLAVDGAAVARWGEALTEDGDLLLYGCDVAKDASGQNFVQELARLTGADVAASTDLTGQTLSGGNWALEYTAGHIEAAVVLQSQQGWNHVLAIGVDSTSTGTSITNSVTISHTTSGSNRLMLVGVSLNKATGTAVSTVNYGGTALALVGTQSNGDAVVEIWRLVNPTLGTANVTVTMNGVTDGNAVGVMTFTGVDQTTPLGTLGGGSGASGGAGTANIASATGELVFGVIGVDDDTNRNLVPNLAQTNDWVVRPSKGINGGGSTKAGDTAPVTLNWTWTGSDNWAVAGVSIKPAATNVAPVNVIPGAQSTNEDTPLIFNDANGNRISISDSDAGSKPLSVTLSVNNGVLTLSGTAGLSFTGGVNGSASLTFTGTLASINSALNGLTFTPGANYNGAVSLQMTTHDDAGLLGSYSFDDTTNSTTLGKDDGPGTADNGTVTGGASFVNDPTRGNVLNLDGVDDGVQIPGLFGEPANVTLSAWINFTGTLRGDIISVGDSLLLRINEPGNAKSLRAIFYDGSAWQEINITTAIANTGWHHVAFTFDDAANQQKLYLDGVVVATGTATQSIDYFDFGDVTYTNSTIGRHANPGASTHFFKGLIDDARIYDRALSAAEIAAVMNSPPGRDIDTVTITVVAVNDPPVAVNDAYATNEDTPLVVGSTTTNLTDWWRFDEGGTSQTLASSGTNGSSATLGSTAGVDAKDPAWTTGRTGGAALSFDGTDDVVTTTNVDLKTASTFTLSAWFQADVTTGARHLLWQGYAAGNGYGNGMSLTPATSEMSLSIGSYNVADNNRIVFSLGYDVPANGADSIFIVSTSAFTDTTSWHHVAVTVADIGGGVMRATLYVDGQLEGSDTGSQNDRAVWGPLLIGSTGSGARSFDGKIDEVRVYSNELSGAQVQAIAKPGVLGNDTDVDNFALQVNLATVVNPVNGSLSINADGSFTYTPNANFFGSDSFSYKANDGSVDSNLATVTITVNAVNDAPTISNLAGDFLPYLGGSGVLVIDQGAAADVLDVDSANFTGGSLTVRFATGGVNAQDALAIRNQGVGAGLIGVAGANVTYSGTVIGSWSGGTGGTSLVVNFNGNATPTSTSALVRNITYQNTAAAASATGGLRTVRFVVSDGAVGGTSLDYDAFVNVGLTVRDNFSAQSYSNNDGSSPWSSSWSEIDSAGGGGGGGAGAGGGNITVNAPQQILRFDGAALGDALWRSANLSGTISATLSFDFDTTSLKSAARIDLQVSSNGGGSYTTLHSFTSAEQVVSSKSFDISAFTSANTTVRFIVTTSALSQNKLEFDNIQIAYINNTAPVLDASKSPVLNAINEDAAAPVGAVGTLVSSLVDFAVPTGQVDNVADPDTGAQLGIAVIGANTTNGAWWYSTTNGSSWIALGVPSPGVAQLLAADARLYFQPTANYHGSIADAISFRAWDRTSGSNGGTASTLTNGGITAFSVTTDTAALTVNPIADTPSVTDATTNEDTQTTNGLVISRNAADGAEVTHFKIIGISYGALFQNDGVTAVGIGSFITAAQGTAGLRFTPAQDFFGSGSFAVQASTSNLDAGLGGGTATATISVTAINDPPTINNLADDFLPYVGGSGVLLIDRGVAADVLDVDSTNFNGGSLTVRFAAGGINAQDVLAIRHQGIGAGQIGLSGANVSYAGTVIGTWSGGSGGTSLVVGFNSNATPTASSALLRNITYQNTTVINPTSGLRTVRFVLNDGAIGGTSADYDAFVNVGRTVRDNFTVESYGNNDGTDNWSSSWLDAEASGGAGASSGTIKWLGGKLQVTLNDLNDNIIRGVNLAGATSATLSYSYDSTGFNSPQPAVQVQVSGDGGSTYRVLKTYNTANKASGTDSFALLGSEMTANTLVRIIVTGSKNNSNILFDDIQVAFVLNNAPVLDASKTPVLGSINEDSGAPVGAVGTLVSTLVDSGGPLNNVSDADGGAQLGIAVTAAATSNGSWFYSTDNGSAWNAMGAVSDANARLLVANGSTRIYFQPSANYHGTQASALTFRAWDWTSGSNGALLATGGGGGSSAFSVATDTVSLSVNPVADTPSVSNSSTNEDTQTTSGLVISRNAADGPEVTHFKITSIVNGTLFLNDGITAIGNGSFITAADGAAGLRFTPAQDFFGSGSFVVQGSTSNLDAGLGGGTATATVTVIAVNDAPLITANGNALAYPIGSGVVAVDASLSVVDVDSANLSSATVTISTGYVNGKDVLSFTNQNGIVGSWSAATGVLSLSGNATVLQYQTALRSVTFQSSATSSGARAIAFQARDSAAALSEAAFRTVALGQEVPALWISSTGNSVTSAGTGSFAYSDALIARLANPNLALGSGISNGSFSGVFDLDRFAADGNAKLNGLHYVNSSVTVGTTNPVTLQRGDILLSTEDDETLGGVATSKKDVVLFRPTTPGDYSAGSFSILLRNPGNIGNVHDFALVETTMTVGGTALQAGDFLMVFTGGSYDKDVQRFRPTTMSTNPTGGTMSVLIDGDGSAGIGFSQKIYGLELVQQNFSFGGVSLTQGQLLITVNNNTTVGSNNLAVTARDVFVLNVTATGIGTSSGTASMLLRGADVGLTGGSEEHDALALVAVYNTAPSLDATRTPVLTAQDEDSGAPSGAVGTLVSSLVDFSTPAGQVDNVSDPDTDPQLGIAVIASNTTNGSWWFSINSGGNWNVLTAVSTPSARLLAADTDTRIYFQPNANFNGTIADAISFRAWDRTTGSNGALFDTSFNGGASAFSSAFDGANLTINAVNDAPTLGNGSLAGVNEDTANPPGQSVATIFVDQFADVDVGAGFRGIAVVGNSANTVTQGAWQYSTNAGTNWFAIGGVADGAGALALSTSTLVRFVPVANFNGTPAALVVRGLDDTYAGSWSSTAGSESRVVVDTTGRGGSSAIAAATANLSTAINPVADTPSVSNANTAMNTQTTSGLVISRNAADGAEVSHFKITAINNGTLYKNDGVTVIAAGSFITAAEGSAGLKFTPTTGFTGSGGFSVRASTSNIDAGLGGSTVNATIAINTAPTIVDGAIVALAGTDENTLSPATTVDAILTGAGWADADGGALKGIAITAVSGIGSWQYSTDGITWKAVGSVSTSNSLLLDATTRLRFQPDTLNGGPASLGFKAWDRSTGTASTNTVRGLADPGNGGGSSAFSSQSASASMTVTAINDAPTLTDRALQFDGSDVVVVADHASLVMSTTMTVEATIQRTGPAAGNQIILNKEGEYEIGINASGQLQWAFANTTPGWTWVATSFTVPVDTWVSVAVSYNAGAVKVYVDGVQVDSSNGSGAIGDVYPAMNDLTIGGRQNATMQRFVGLIDEVRVWNVERSGAQISAAYNTALTGSETGLVGYWRFSEASGKAAIDSSTMGNHGVLGNGGAADVPARTGNLDYTLAEDGSLNVAAPGLLARATDPEGTVLTAVLVSGPANASFFSLNPNGSFTYTPTADFNGVDSFVFRASDGSLASQPATVYLNVTPVNDAPTLANASLGAVDEDTVNPPGATLGTIFSGKFADVDAGSSFSGIAVVGNSANALTQGSWQYSTNGGGNWFAIGAVADNATALALASSSLVRFVPVADFYGTPPALLLRGLDNSYAGGWSSTAGSETRTAVDTTGNGGSTAIAAATTTLSTAVTAVADTPTVSNATTDEDTQSSSGLVISRNVADGAEVSHFKITGISNGVLYKNDGVTVISAGSFITVAEGSAGLKFTPTADFNGSGNFTVQASTSNADAGLGGAPVVATITVNAVNDAPTTTPVTLTPIAEDSGSRLITQAELLANAADIDSPSLSAINLLISSGAGSLVDNGNGTWSYTPALNDDTSVSFSYTVTDGSLGAPGSATLDITPVNDAPTTSPVTLTAIAEDSGPRLITQAELLANAADVDGPGLTAINLAISSGAGSLVDNGNGSWTYNPALNDDTSVIFNYTVTDGSLSAPGSATLDITPVNDAPTTSPVTLSPIAEDSGLRLITQAELLANSADIDGPSLSAINLFISSGAGSLIDNGNGSWSYTPALNDDTGVSFSYTVTDGSLTAPGVATLDITPVNDAPTTSPVTLTAIDEDIGPRLITQAELLSNAVDVDGPSLSAINLVISSGAGSLIDNGNGTWSYTPALNDDTSVSFSYTVTDGSLGAPGSASLDITPVNDAPTTSPVTLSAIAEDSGPRLITQAELLANATDVDGPSLSATNLAISSGAGSLVDNGDGSWTYSPALNDDTAISFSYTVTDGSLSASGSATLDITPVNDAPTNSPVTLAAIAEDSGPRLITQAELLSNAVDVDGPSLTAINLAISSGAGSLVDNGDGTWTYTPALNDDTSVSFSYTVTDGSLSAAGGATLDITAVNDAPTNNPITLTAIAEDSGARLITQAELLANAEDVDGPALTAINLAISSGAGSLVDNGDGTWTFTPALNDDTNVSFSYTVTDGSLTVPGSATLDITPVNDAPTTSPVTLTAIAEDSGPRLITQAELLANAADVDGPGLTATNLVISSGAGSLVDNGNGTWTYTTALDDDTSVAFSYIVSDGSLTATGSATLDITPVNDGPTNSPVTLTAIAEDSGPRLITQAELLANAADVDGPTLTAINLLITSGAGSLVDNGDGTWTYSPALNDDTGVSFSYTVTDGSLSAPGSATLDITPVNDAPTNSPITLTAIAEDSGPRLITQAELLANAADVDGPALTAINLVITSGAGSLVDNGDGTWTYTPALNDDTSVAFSYIVSDGSLTAAGTATLDITPVNDGPTNGPVTLTAIAEDSGARLITQAELLTNAADVDGPTLTAINLLISSGAGSLVDNGDGSWTYSPALNDDTGVSFSYTVTDGSLSAPGSATLDITPVNDAPTNSPITLTAIAEDSGPRLITQAELLANAADVDGPSLTAINLVISSGAGSLVDNGDGTWTYTPALNDDTSVSFNYTVTDGSLSAPGSATIDITPVNDAPTTSPVTLSPIAEDSGARLITQAELLANAADVDGPSLTAINLTISSGLGSLLDNGNGTWTYTPAANDDTGVSFSYTVTDGSLSAPGSATLDITAVNDVPTTSPVTLSPIAEDSGARLITQAELLVNAADVDGPALTAINLVITSGAGSLVDNGDGTWTYTPALNDDTGVSFNYTVTDGSLSAPGSATLDITPVNDAPTNSPITLTAIAEDSGPRLITRAELLANAADVDGPALTAINLVITSGAGSLVDNGDGTWTYTPALNDDTGVSFNYTVTDGSLSAPGSATIDITPVNDAPTTSPVTLSPIAEDSGARLITQAELLANAADVDGPGLAAINLTISSGLGSLLDNGGGTWTYTPAANDDTGVSFSYTVTDGSLSAAGSATLDITAVNDAPTTSPVTLAAIAEDSGPRLITQAELLANAADVDGPTLTAINLVISVGAGSLVDNGNGTWSYTPALNDDTSVSFNYTVTDGSLSAPGSTTLDITPVNDAPTTSPVTLSAIAEDSGARLITQAELLANAADVDGPALTATNLVISSGGGSLVDNGNGTWTYTPALNDDTSVAFSYLVSDGSLSAPGSATLDITPVNDGPTNSPVTLTAIAEDSGPRLITQAELLANAADVDGPTLTAINLVISSGAGSLVENGDGTWTYSPALNDDTSVSFNYTVTDGSLSAPGSATLDITLVNDAPTTSPVTLSPIAEDSGARLITQAELLANAGDVDGPSLTAINLTISSGLGSLLDNGDGTWTFTPAVNDDTVVSFSYTVTDGSLTAPGSATLDITPVNDAPTTSPVTLSPIAEDSGPRLITQAELLANGADVDGPSLTAINLVISGGTGSLIDNGDGTWTFTPALDDDTSVEFSYTITDGQLSAAGLAILDITPVDDAPVASLAPIALQGGGNVQVDSRLLQVSDSDSAVTALGFVVLSVQHGQFEFRDAPGVVILNFSQADVSAGRVVFVSTSAVETPGFTLAAFDGNSYGEPFIASIDFRRNLLSTTSTPELAPDGRAPVPQQPAAPVDGRVTAQTGSDRESVVDFSLPTAGRDLGTLPRPQGIIIAEAAQTGLDQSFAAISSSEEPVRPRRASNFDNPEFYTRVSADDYVARTDDFQLVDLLLLTSSGSRGGIEGFEAGPHSSEGQSNSGVTLTDAARASAVALTAGTVWWALRAGSLLTGLLVTMPAWRHADLLAVLPDEEEEDSWDLAEDKESARDERAVDLVFETEGPERRD